MLTCRNAICDDKLLSQSSGEIEHRFTINIWEIYDLKTVLKKKALRWHLKSEFGALSLWFLWFIMDIYGYFNISVFLVCIMAFVAGIIIRISSLPLVYCLFLTIPGGLQFGRCRGGLRGEFSTEMVVSAQGKVLPISHYVVVSNMFSCSSLPAEMIFNWVETTK